ncbi:MAG: hypothetical protein ABID54_05130, partial [Pseudomonadota bacterium]
RFSRSLENSTSYYRCLKPTQRTLIKHLPDRPSLYSTTTRAAESVSPAQMKQVFAAFLFGGKSILKVSYGTGIIFHTL